MPIEMSLDDIKKRFVQEIKLRAYDDKYIDKNEEREILQIAIQLGIEIENARTALIEISDEHGYVIESRVVKAIKEQVGTAIGAAGKVDRAGFDRIVANVRQQMHGQKNEREVKRMVVTVMEETGNNRVKTGWFRNWYAALKSDLGMR